MKIQLEVELWKDIKNFEGLYQVSNYGNIKALEKKIQYSDGRIRTYKESLIKLQKNSKGYIIVGLTKNKIRSTHIVHRLVAETFLNNLDNFNEVNHIDENKNNNYYLNLEWCSRKYNNDYSNITQKLNNSKKKRVNQLNLDGSFIKTWNGIREASNGLGMKTHKHIIECCKNRLESCYGYKWTYAN